MIENKKICYIHIVAVFEVILVIAGIILYLVYNNPQVIIGDVASALFFAIILVLLLSGLLKIKDIKHLTSKNAAYYLIANVLAFLYAIVAFLSKIAILFDNLLNQINTPIRSLIYPIDIFFLISIIMSLLLPLIYFRGKYKLGVK